MKEGGPAPGSFSRMRSAFCGAYDHSSVLFPMPSRLFSTSLLTRYTRSESCTCTYLVPSPESLPR